MFMYVYMSVYLLNPELDMEWIHPWIGFGWIGWDDCGPFLISRLIIAAQLMLFISNYEL